MSDSLDSRRVLRGMSRALKAAKELFTTKEREIAAARRDAEHWQARHDALKRWVDEVFTVKVTPCYERGPRARRIALDLDLDAVEVADRGLLIHTIARDLVEKLK